MEITACIVAKNEEKLLDGCLRNISDKFDEIVVVDCGSIDNTKIIAEQYGCKVLDATKIIQHHNLDYYEPLRRNIYLEAASNPWLLIIDCDERLEEAGISQIRNKLKSARPNVYGFCLPRIEYLGNGQWANNMTLRIVRKHPAIRYDTINIHPSLAPSIMKLRGEINNISSPIHHFDILIPNRARNKRVKYRSKLKLELNRSDLEPRDRSKLHLFLGLEYTAIREFIRGEKEYRKALAIDPTNINLGSTFLAQNYLAMGDYARSEEEALKVLRSTSLFAYNEPALVLLAEISMKRGDIDKTISYCDTMLENNPLGSHLYINKASLLQNIDPKAALELAFEAINLNKYLHDPRIYKLGEEPNLFTFQNSFLSRTQNIFEIISNCLFKLNRVDEAKLWSGYQNQVLRGC